MKIGIYQILNVSNGKCYIGKSTNIDRREKEHFDKIKKGKHDNKKLQLEIKENLVFNVLIECDFKDLDYYEWFYIKSYNSLKNGYNIAKPQNFKNVNLLEYKNVIKDFKELLNKKLDNKQVSVSKKYLKNKYDIFNFSAFCNLIRKESFEKHTYEYAMEGIVYFGLKTERDKLFDSLNY